MVRVSGALPYVSLLLVVGGDPTHARAHDDHTHGVGAAWRAGHSSVLTERPWHSLATDAPPFESSPSQASHSTLATPTASQESTWGAALQYARGKRKTWHPFDPHSGEPGSVSPRQDLMEDGLEDLLSLYPGSWGRQGKRRGSRRRSSHGRHKLRHGKRRRHHPRTLLLLEAGLSVEAGQEKGTTLTSPYSPSSSAQTHTYNELSAAPSTAASPPSPHPAWEHEAHLPLGTHTPAPVSVPLLNSPLPFTSRPDDQPQKQRNSSMAFPSEATGGLSERPGSGGPLKAPPTTAHSPNEPLDDLLQYSLGSLRSSSTERQQAEGVGRAETLKQSVTHEPPTLVAGREESAQPVPPPYQHSPLEAPAHRATQRPENSRHDLRESNKRQTIKLGSGARHTSPMSPEAQPTIAAATHAHHKHTHTTTPGPSAAALLTNLAIDHVKDSEGRERSEALLSSLPIHHTPVEIPSADLRRPPTQVAGLSTQSERSLPGHHSSITILSQLATARPRPVPDPPVQEEGRTGGGGCYSTNDVVVVVFLTSLANMVAFVVVTVALCWCSLRARAAPPPRPPHPDDTRQDTADDDAEETAVPEGCLEACLPDISYQRHLARGSSIRPSFVVGRALRPLVHAHSPRPLSHAVHELLHNLTAPTEAGEEEEEGQERREEKGKKRRGCLVKRRSLSLENLMLT